MEKAKFPMEVMGITQGYDMGTHKGTYALDIAGKDTGIDWVLAPFTGTIKCVLNDSYGIWYWFESNEKVLCANGEVTKLVAMFGHDNEIRHKVGDVIKQGELLCAEGTSGNATGNHCHMEIGKGEYAGTWYKNSDGVYMLYNAVKPNEYLCVPDNYVIKKDGGYDWKKESEVQEPQSDIKYLNLNADITDWNVYPMNVAPVSGNECFEIMPSKFGGLSYTIKGYTMENVAIIETRDFSQVQIYIGPETYGKYSITDKPLFGLVK